LVSLQAAESLGAVVYVRHNGPAYPSIASFGRLLRIRLVQRVIAKLEGHVEYRRNPREWPYMEELLRAQQRFESGQLKRSSELGSIDWSAVREIVLLWPDGNGLGWAQVERQIFRRIPSGAKVTVLNGRRRAFQLERTLWLQYLWRRFLEKTFAADLILTAVFLASTPVLAVWDRLRGRT
jgi:hypothetical protein